MKVNLTVVGKVGPTITAEKLLSVPSYSPSALVKGQ